jgi:hypothetical protein
MRAADAPQQCRRRPDSRFGAPGRGRASRAGKRDRRVRGGRGSGRRAPRDLRRARPAARRGAAESRHAAELHRRLRPGIRRLRPRSWRRDSHQPRGLRLEPDHVPGARPAAGCRDRPCSRRTGRRDRSPGGTRADGPPAARAARPDLGTHQLRPGAAGRDDRRDLPRRRSAVHRGCVPGRGPDAGGCEPPPLRLSRRGRAKVSPWATGSRVSLRVGPRA